MRIAIRIFLLLIFGAAFVGAVVLSYRGTFESHTVTWAIPKIYGQQKSAASTVVANHVGGFSLSWRRATRHNGTDWIDTNPATNGFTYRASGATARMPFVEPVFSVAGFEFGESKIDRRLPFDGVVEPILVVSSHTFVFPWWFIVLITGLPAGYLAVSLRYALRRKFSPTQCRTCGYDLRAGHDKCPGCGADSHVLIGASDVTDNLTAPSGQR